MSREPAPRRRMRRRLLAGASGLGLAAVAAAGVTLAPAQAASAGRLCTFTPTYTLSPAMHWNQTTRETISGSGTFTQCLDANSNPIGVTGTYTVSGSGPVSCTARVGAVTLTYKIKWSDGNTSTIRLTAPTNFLLTGPDYIGAVQSGQFSGVTASSPIFTNALAAQGPCTTSRGLTSITGGGNITIG